MNSSLEQVERAHRISDAMRHLDNVTLTELSRRVGKSKSTMQKIVHAKTKRRSSYFDIADILQVPVEWLLDGSNPPDWWDEKYQRVFHIETLQRTMNLPTSKNRFLLIDLGQSEEPGVFFMKQGESIGKKVDYQFLSSICK